jgi:hypothetical protein
MGTRELGPEIRRRLRGLVLWLAALSLLCGVGCAGSRRPVGNDGGADVAVADGATDGATDGAARDAAADADAGSDSTVDGDVEDGAVEDGGPDGDADAGPCVPDCVAAACGPDGCGGTCGSCAGERLCTQGRACVPVLYPASGREIGVDYHATGPDFDADAFLTVYDQAAVRSLVQTQLAGLAAAGATVVSTRIWFVVDPGTTPAETWKHHFPLSSSEVANLRLYAQDVAGAGLKLYLTFLYLWCAQYTAGTPTSSLGHCGLTASDLVDRVQQSVGDALAAVRDVYLPSGRPVVERLFLDGEVMTASSGVDSATQWEKANQRWFLSSSGLWAWFWNAVRQAGMIPSLYFIHATDEPSVLGDGYADADYAALDGHRSMFWIYRTLKFLADNSLPVPDRIDFSSYPTPELTNHATLFNRVFHDFEAVIPPLLGVAERDYFVAETFYYTDAGLRQRAHKGLAAQFALRPRCKGANFWTTPNAGGAGDHAGYPFVFSGLDPSDITTPTFANPSFETDGTCGAGDGAANPAGFCTEWPNGNVTSWHIGRSAVGPLDGGHSLEVFFGACVTQPCQGSLYPGVYVLSDAATGAAPGWALLRIFGRYDGSDHAGSLLLIDNDAANAAQVSMIQSAGYIEYVLLGPVATTNVKLRLQISSPTPQNRTARFDLVH